MRDPPTLLQDEHRSPRAFAAVINNVVGLRRVQLRVAGERERHAAEPFCERPVGIDTIRANGHHFRAQLPHDLVVVLEHRDLVRAQRRRILVVESEQHLPARRQLA